MITKHKALTVALDCDDVLCPCIDLALKQMQKKYNYDPPLDINEVTGWAPTGDRTDIILECFQELDFFEMQKPYEGAVEFVRELSKIADVYIMTAVPYFAMSTRGKMLLNYFMPYIKADHIIMTSSKNLVDIDVLLDDAPHNILSTQAKYPVIMRRPWNQHLTGILAVNNYNEFLCLVNEIKNRYTETPIDRTKPCIVGLVGSSGSGKTTLAQKLIETGLFEQPLSYTDREPTDENEKYNFISTDEFYRLKESGEIFESTNYANYNYGSSLAEIKKITDANKHVVIPVDMCGAMGLKSTLNNVITVYVDRDKKELVSAILEKNCSNQDKVNRIISIDAEARNADICDYVVNNRGDINAVVHDILSMIKNGG